MAGYIGSKASVVSNGAERKKVFDITATTTSLTGCSYTPNQVHVFHNGVRLVDGTDYTATDGSTITLTTAAQAGDEVVVVSYATFQPADAYTKTESDNRFVNDPNAVITVSGSNVGIGTSSPVQALHIVNSGFTYARMQSTAYGGTGFDIGQHTNGNVYLNNRDNTNIVLQTNNTERMRIDSAGRVIMPYQPAFSAHCSVHAVNNTIVFDQVATNRGNHYNSTTGFFTAPVAGAYYFSFFAMNGSSSGNLRARFHINNAAHPSGEHYGGVGYTGQLSYNQFSIMSVLILNANDTVSVFWDPLYNNIHSYHNKFNGYLIG